MHDVFVKGLRDVRRSFLWWSLGLVSMTAMMVSVYPSVRDNRALSDLVDDYPDALKGFIGFGGSVDYTSAPGYLGIELFSLTIPLLLLIAAIATGSNGIAGEEERGTLDMLLTLPVSRRQVVAAKIGALVVEAIGLATILWLSLAIGVHAVDMQIGVGYLAAATADAVLLALGFGLVALCLGAATGRRSVAIGVATAGAVAAYLVNSLAPLVSGLSSFRRATPFYYYSANDPLRHGLNASHALVLLALAIAASIGALIAIERRDIAG